MSALKQLRINTQLKQLRSQHETLIAKVKEYEERTAGLETALEEASTDEDMNLVNEQIEALEAEIKENDAETKKTEIEEQIRQLEEELDAIGKETPKAAKTQEREANMNKYQVRDLLKTGAYYERSEVKEFYGKLKNIRSMGGSDLIIPQVIINRIMDIFGDYATLYPLVEKIRLTGKGRILLDNDTDEATWIEQTGTIPTGDVGTVTNIDFDGFKVGKVVFIDNSLIQDSIINVDDYVVKKIARALAKAIDKAILKGEGAAKKQPEGIITKLASDHKVTLTDPKLADVLKQIKLIDTGDDSVGEIVAVMKRSTYYDRFLDYTINVDSAGNVVGKLPNLKNINLCGLNVVFNQYMDADNVLFGEFSQYKLVEREDIAIDNSVHVKFAEDQTAFRGKGRFDGKPTNANAFVLVTITDTAPAGE